jgi:hypothetical protein
MIFHLLTSNVSNPKHDLRDVLIDLEKISVIRILKTKRKNQDAIYELLIKVDGEEGSYAESHDSFESAKESIVQMFIKMKQDIKIIDDMSFHELTDEGEVVKEGMEFLRKIKEKLGD